MTCYCNCSGDANNVTVIEWDGKTKPAILLNVDNIRSHQLLNHYTGSYRDIAVFKREYPDKPYSGLIADTLIFKNGIYVDASKDHHVELVNPNDTSLQIQIVNLLKDKSQGAGTIGENKMESAHSNSLSLFKSGAKSAAAHTLLKAVGPKPWTIDNSNVGIFNDLGFFLEESGRYQESVDVLLAVVAKFPDRTPAYLNLADAYDGLKNNDKAKENYKRYADLMTKAGKQAKIPKRVSEVVGK